MRPGWQTLGYSTTSVERASGQHAKNLLVFVEEASGVEDGIWGAIESLKHSRLVAIGNPVLEEGRFIEWIRQAYEYREDQIVQHQPVSAIQVPSTASSHADLEESPHGLADRAWLDAFYRRYGREALWVRSHLRAELRDLFSDQHIPVCWLDYATAVQRPNLPATHPIHRSRRIGIDRGGAVGRDSTSILVRNADGIIDPIAGNPLCLADAAEETARLACVHAVNASRISFGKLGIGRDFRNHLVRRGLGDASGSAGNGKPQEHKAFSNLRSEAT